MECCFSLDELVSSGSRPELCPFTVVASVVREPATNCSVTLTVLQQTCTAKLSHSAWTESAAEILQCRTCSAILESIDSSYDASSNNRLQAMVVAIDAMHAIVDICAVHTVIDTSIVCAISTPLQTAAGQLTGSRAAGQLTGGLLE